MSTDKMLDSLIQKLSGKRMSYTCINDTLSKGVKRITVFVFDDSYRSGDFLYLEQEWAGLKWIFNPVVQEWLRFRAWFFCTGFGRIVIRMKYHLVSVGTKKRRDKHDR